MGEMSTMTNNLYEKGNLKNLSKLKELAPEAAGFLGV